MADHFQLRLVDSTMLAPTVRHMAFERADGQPLAFTPGQFLQTHFHYDDGTATKRSYSVGTVGHGSSPVQRIEIAVSYVEGGAATKLLGELPIGGEISASGPYGRFCLMDADTNARYLLVATGRGPVTNGLGAEELGLQTELRGVADHLRPVGRLQEGLGRHATPQNTEPAHLFPALDHRDFPAETNCGGGGSIAGTPPTDDDEIVVVVAHWAGVSKR